MTHKMKNVARRILAKFKDRGISYKECYQQCEEAKRAINLNKIYFTDQQNCRNGTLKVTKIEAKKFQQFFCQLFNEHSIESQRLKIMIRLGIIDLFIIKIE